MEPSRQGVKRKKKLQKTVVIFAKIVYTER